MKYEDKISYLIDNEVITKPTTMESLVDNMFLLRSQLEAANKVIDIYGFALGVIEGGDDNGDCETALEAIEKVEKIRNGGEG